MAFYLTFLYALKETNYEARMAQPMDPGQAMVKPRRLPFSLVSVSGDTTRPLGSTLSLPIPASLVAQTSPQGSEHSARLGNSPFNGARRRGDRLQVKMGRACSRVVRPLWWLHSIHSSIVRVRDYTMSY